ncbi:MAG: spermidine synthase [Gammaproteobacteria bacterium]|nr:spermidine synthase [Gammaproteobacteria bacterium]
MRERRQTRRHGGELIYTTNDEYGPIEVVESAFERSLHFGSPAKQSSILLDNHQMLALSYTHALLAPLIFQPLPQRILLVGLGGGSVASFLLHHFPDAEIDVVELRQRVYYVARRYFHLPDSLQLTVYIESIERYMYHHRSRLQNSYDLVLIDAFDGEGVSAEIANPIFCREIRDLLSPRGVLGINLWSGADGGAAFVVELLMTAFDRNLLRLDVEEKGNLIAITADKIPLQSRLDKCDRDARHLTSELRLPFTNMVKRLRRLNLG